MIIDGIWPQNSMNRVKALSGNFFPVPKEKTEPQDLMEEVNQSSVPSGGTIMVMSNKNKGDIKKITNNVFITNLNMSYKEKAQLLETFGASNVSFFGDSIKVYQISGQAVDYPSTGKNPERSMNLSALNMMYNNHLRATKLLKNDNIGVVKIFNHLIYGYALNFRSTYNATRDKIGTFSLSWLVVKHTQNLPGMFSEKDLEKSTDDTTLANTDQGKAALRFINNYMAAAQENLMITLNQDGEVLEEGETASGRGKIAQLDLLDFISSTEASTVLAFKENIATITRIPINSDNFENVETAIKDGISSFIKVFKSNEVLNDYKPEGYEKLSLYGDNDLANHVPNMFTSSESYNRIKDFLRVSVTVRSSLITRKMQIVYGS